VQCIYKPLWSKISDEKLIAATLLKKDFGLRDNNLVAHVRISPFLTYLVPVLSNKKLNHIIATYLFKITFILWNAKVSHVN
jgi:hypothetical protein